MFINESRCPSCGIESNVFMKDPKIFICPTCSTVFSEFGLVRSGVEQEVQLS
ncbi:MAG: hypothetical protein HY362_05015 [Candidatus Aenigmarchaeota archaeon]|nr:hypothetical protein [Candidatus Aenigmarchaeota archaeon]